MMGESGNANLLRGSIHSSLAFANTQYFLVWRIVWPFLPHAFKQTTHIRYHRHFPSFAGSPALQPGLGFAAHGYFASPQIAISPGDVPGFVDTKPSKGEELDQFSARFR